jgi:hypothetical protein
MWRGGCSGDGVKVASTIAVKHHTPSRDILDRKTKSIKFDRTVVVPSELTTCNMKILTIANGNKGMRGRMAVLMVDKYHFLTVNIA